MKFQTNTYKKQFRAQFVQNILLKLSYHVYTSMLSKVHTSVSVASVLLLLPTAIKSWTYLLLYFTGNKKNLSQFPNFYWIWKCS